MKIAFVVERPTQFEAPFYRYAAAHPGPEGDTLRVLFTGGDLGRPAFDPELGAPVTWGIDLWGDYPQATCPTSGRLRWLAREITRENCDLLIVNGYTQKAYLQAAAVARLTGVRTALRLDSVLWPGAAPNAARRLLFDVLPYAFDLFLGVGTLTLDYLAACGVPAARTGLFPYAVDVEHFRTAARQTPEERAARRARLGLGDGDRAVLAVTKLAPREAPWDLLRALPHLPPEVRLVIAGDGPARPALERLAAELGGGRVRFLGYVPYGELPALYAAVDLFAHAVQEERWGVSVAEALACGLPVVTSSRVGAARDLLPSGANGSVYPVGDPEALARAIAAALALDPKAVARCNREVLSHWDYAASWRSLRAAAGALG